jgi:hypothetical protein
MGRPSDVGAWIVIRRLATITVIGAVASFAFSVSPRAGARVSLGPSSLDFRALALPKPEPVVTVHGWLSWDTQELCGFGDRVPPPAMVFSDEHGKVVGVIRPPRVTEYRQRAPFPGTGIVLCGRSAPYSGTIREAPSYEISIEGTVIAGISLAELRERGFELDVAIPTSLTW